MSLSHKKWLFLILSNNQLHVVERKKKKKKKKKIYGMYLDFLLRIQYLPAYLLMQHCFCATDSSHLNI